MKTSSIRRFIGNDCVVYGVYGVVDTHDIRVALEKEPVKGAILRFKDTNPYMNIFFNFTKDTISIDRSAYSNTNDGTNAETSKEMREDYKKIKNKFKFVDLPDPVIHSDLNSSGGLEMNMHTEEKVTNTKAVLDTLLRFESNRNYDIKDISVFSKSMFRLPRIFKYVNKP